jgi:ABC-type uncharacterized transport system permease subunit
MKSEKEVEERLKEIQTLDGLRASVLHIFSNALMFFMFYCIVMMLVSYFWIPRTYNVYELKQRLLYYALFPFSHDVWHTCFNFYHNFKIKGNKRGE